jgi:hypothetical protein
MSYNFPSTNAYSFLDTAAACGVSSQSRDRCACGEATQNNHQTLVRFHGAVQPGTPPPPPPTDPPTGGDTQAPTVTLESPTESATYPTGSEVRVVARATDNVGVTSVQLYWAFNNHVVGCDPNHALFPCTQSADSYTWTVKPGDGPREFYVMASDAAGNRSQSATRTIRLGETGTPPPPSADAPPTVVNVLPVMNQLLTPGAELIFQARASDDKGIRQVSAIWTFQSETGPKSVEYNLPELGSGIYSLTTSLAPTARTGTRTVTFRAVDTAGQTTDLGPLTVHVR